MYESGRHNHSLNYLNTILKYYKAEPPSNMISIISKGLINFLGFIIRVYFPSLGFKKSHIRGELGRRIGKQARIVPDLRFFLDETEEQAAKMDELFKDLEIPPTEEETDNPLE